MGKTVHSSDVSFTGGVSMTNAASVNYKPGSIVDADLSSAANVAANKLVHARHVGTRFGLAVAGTPVAREEVVFVAGEAGTITGFHAMLNVTGTSTNIDFDLKVNGASVLTAVVNIVHGTANRATVNGSIATAAVAAGDVISISMAVTSSTGAQGPWAWLEYEDTVS